MQLYLCAFLRKSKKRYLHDLSQTNVLSHAVHLNEFPQSVLVKNVSLPRKNN